MTGSRPGSSSTGAAQIPGMPTPTGTGSATAPRTRIATGSPTRASSASGPTRSIVTAMAWGLMTGTRTAIGDGVADGLEQDRRPVPAALVPPLDDPRSDRPITYRTGCHLGPGEQMPRRCFFGDTASSTTVVLFGDSRAASWLPALIEIGSRRGWRILPITKSACPSAWIDTDPGSGVTECAAWRANALRLIASVDPGLVLVSGFGGYTLWRSGAVVPSSAWAAAWRDAWALSLQKLRRLSPSVALIADTPRYASPAMYCLRRHPVDISACATRRGAAVSPRTLRAEREGAALASVPLITSAPLVCPYDPCPVVVDDYLVLFDGAHIPATYSRSWRPALSGGCRVDGRAGAPTASRPGLRASRRPDRSARRGPSFQGPSRHRRRPPTRHAARRATRGPLRPLGSAGQSTARRNLRVRSCWGASKNWSGGGVLDDLARVHHQHPVRRPGARSPPRGSPRPSSCPPAPAPP